VHFLTKSDRMTRYKALGCIIGLGGLLVLGASSGSGSGGERLLRWDILMFLSGACFSVSNILAKALSRRIDPLLLSGWAMLLGGLALCVIALSLGAEPLHGSPLGWVMFVALALSSVVSVGLWNWLLKRCPVSSISVFTCLMPVIGSLLSAALLHEQVFTLSNLLSLVMVSSGVFFVNYHFQRNSKPCTAATK
jgi:drug/metabolite transporter (DMT)-like permease